jgi:hypothetical protein
MKILKHVLLPLILMSPYAMTATPGNEPRWYEIELYLFKRNSETDEKWPDPRPFSSKKALIPLLQNQANLIQKGHVYSSQSMPSQVSKETKPFVLPEQFLQFGNSLNYMNKKLNLEPLIHMTWRQGIRSEKFSQPIGLYLGQDFSEKYRMNGYLISDTKDLSQAVESKVRELTGSINIYIDHYLFVEVDLKLRKESKIERRTHEMLSSLTPSSNSNSFTFLEQIPMQQKKHVRSDEVHYFDHPYLGMILEIRKIAKN